MIPAVADKQKNSKRKDKQYNVSTLAVKELSDITQEVLTIDRSELRKISRASSKIEKKLIFQYLYEIECCNKHLSKRVMKLEGDNDDCHRCIGKLFLGNHNLREMAIELPMGNDGDYVSMFTDNVNANNNQTGYRIVDREESLELFSSMRKGFLVENTSRDGREKLQDKVDVQSESIVNSHIDREIFKFEEAFYNH